MTGTSVIDSISCGEFRQCTADAYLQQLLEERDEVRPFVHVVKRAQALLHLLGVLLVLRIRCITDGCGS